MKAILTTTLIAASSAVLMAAPAPSTAPLQAVPKNLARQHYGANLSRFDATAQRYVATQAAAAWLDDDVSTGWPTDAGKQYYLLQLKDAHLITNFALSTRAAQGTISLFTGDEAAAPGAPAWKLAAKDVPFATVNNKKLSRPLNKTAKFLLIETNVTDSAPTIDSLYVYGDKSAATETIVKRTAPVEVRNFAGEYANDQTSFNLSSVYAKAKVTFANTEAGSATWQRAIDDNPESFISVKPTTNESGAIVKFDGTHSISRLSALADAGSKGKLDIFLLSQAPENNQALSIEGLTPSATINFDGVTPRGSADVAETEATAMVLRWTPETAGTALALREINTFGDLSMTAYEVASTAPVAEGPEGALNESIALNNEGKEILPIGEGSDPKDGKAMLPPVLDGPPQDPPQESVLPPVVAGPGFTPGRLGFPPGTIRRPLSN